MKTNYHTHTLWCDGKNSPAEMTEAAIARGFDILGFSAHAMYPFAAGYHLQTRDYRAYLDNINGLKERYGSRITVLAGFEVDYFPPISYADRTVYRDFNADFTIGAVHFLDNSQNRFPGFFEVDAAAEDVRQGIESIFAGDGKTAVQTYFDRVREMLRNGKFDILAHADLIRKRNGILRFFNEAESWYKSEIEATAREAGRAGIIAEINTGAIARGAMEDIYPSADFLERLCKYGVPITINSDAHRCEHLDVGRVLAEKRARDAGYKSFVYIDPAGAIRETS